MGLLKEFKEFAMRGNVMDLAVAVIMGNAFNKIVTSLVADVIMPPISNVISGVDIKNWTIDLPNFRAAASAVTEGVDKVAAAATAEPVTIKIGEFLQNTLDFVIVAFCIFMMIKLLNFLTRKKKEDPKPAELSPQEKLLTEIRDLLKSQSKPQA